ncbi:whey acidic protein-like isoform X2 [Cebus imitator]|uniref:whey acidic protein-like isoform X2 n=1 Tax=Cebus imitator TaxID=2715852 RepID=UPI000809D615|nr:whey acidic protein-like isoform X2 [Cebus imitator]
MHDFQNGEKVVNLIRTSFFKNGPQYSGHPRPLSRFPKTGPGFFRHPRRKCLSPVGAMPVCPPRCPTPRPSSHPGPLNVPQVLRPPSAACLPHATMRCLLSLALALLALEVTLAAVPAFISPEQAVCPEASYSEEAPCVKTCLTDNDCLGNSKCCPSTCGRSCKTPTIVLTPKIGSCPWVQPPVSPELCKEQSECSMDSQCWGNKKCCFSRCAMKCLDPVLEDLPQ